MSRSRNFQARPPTVEVVETPRSSAEIALEDFLQDNIRPLVGEAAWARLLDLTDLYGKASYGRGYMLGGRDSYQRGDQA